MHGCANLFTRTASVRFLVRILYVHHGKGIGGAPLSLLYLIRGLDRSRYMPVVLCLRESQAADLFRRDGLETVVMESIKDFSHTNVLWYPWWQFPKTLYRAAMIPVSYVRARSFLKNTPFDIVHLNTSTLGAFGMAAKREGCRVVWHIREPVARGYFGVRRWWIRRTIDRNADAIVPICRYDASQLRQSGRITVVYNFVDFRVFDASRRAPDLRKQLEIDPDAKIVLMLGGSNPIKGTEQFVRAAVQIAERQPGAVFLIAGEIPGNSFRERLNGRTAYHRRTVGSIPGALTDRIRFIGVRNDIPDLLAEAYLLCFPSTTPHFARPVIEASAMGKPVVASDLGGPQELVRNGETGLLVPPCDTGALALAMERLLSDSLLAQTMGRNGLEFARVHFDAETNTRAIQEVYLRLMQE